MSIVHIKGTSSNSFSIGNYAPLDDCVWIYAFANQTNTPYIRYNQYTLKWELSNNGINTIPISLPTGVNKYEHLEWDGYNWISAENFNLSNNAICKSVGNFVLQPGAGASADLSGKVIINDNTNTNGYLGFFVQSGSTVLNYAGIVYDKFTNKWMSRVDGGSWIEIGSGGSSGSGLTNKKIATDVLISKGYSNSFGLTELNLTGTSSVNIVSDKISSIQYMGNGQVIANDTAVGGITKSKDYGKTWVKISITATDAHTEDLLYLGDGKVLALLAELSGGNYISRFYMSGDFGETWESYLTIEEVRHNHTIIKCANNVLLYVFFENETGLTITRSTDLGLTWAQVYSCDFQGSYGGIYCGDGVVIVPTGAIGNYNAVRSVDNGLNWTPINIDTNWLIGGSSFLFKNNICSCGDGILLAAESYSNLPLSRSTDNGATWQQTAYTFNNVQFIQYLGHGYVLLYSSDGLLYESFDDGLTWGTGKAFAYNYGTTSILLDSRALLIGNSDGNLIRINAGFGSLPSSGSSQAATVQESILFASVNNTNNYNWTRVATKPINGTQFPTPTFYAVLERSSTLFNVECKLFNRTLGTDVANSLVTISTSSLGPIKCSAVITLPTTEYLYDILYHITTTNPGQSDTCAISFAGLLNS